MTTPAMLPTAAQARAHPVTWAMYASEGAWQPAALQWYLADLALRVLSSDTLTRLAVSVPPQHGKTELLSVYLPSWHLGRNPTERVLQVSYGADLTTEWTGRERDLLARCGPEVFGVTTWERARRAAWDVYDARTQQKTGGTCRGVGVGGAVPGRPGDFVVVDDPVKGHEEVSSPTMRERVWKWIESSVFPRARRLFLVATRWHDDDIIGRLLARQAKGEVGEPWEFVNIPAVAEERTEHVFSDGTVWAREPGDVLWPDNPQARGDPDWYRRKRVDVGPYTWGALYQGQPVPLEGGMFKGGWFQRYDSVPEGLAKVCVVDLATSKRDTADHLACGTFAVAPGWERAWLVDVVHTRAEGPQIAPLLQTVRSAHRPRVIFLLATGHLAIVQLCRQAGLPVRAIQETGDKVARALSATAEVQAGRILFPRTAPWLAGFEREVLRFGPGSDEDDQVDMLSAFAALMIEHRAAGAGGARFHERAARTARPAETGPHGRTW